MYICKSISFHSCWTFMQAFYYIMTCWNNLHGCRLCPKAIKQVKVASWSWCLFRLSSCFRKKGDKNDKTCLKQLTIAWQIFQWIPNLTPPRKIHAAIRNKLTHRSCRTARQQNPGASAKGRWTKRPRRPADLNRVQQSTRREALTALSFRFNNDLWDLVSLHVKQQWAALRKIKYVAAIS